MNRKIASLVVGAAVAGGAMTALAQQATAPADVKIETTNLAPGIYMLTGRGGNIGLTVGADGAAIIDDQFADMVPKIRAAVALLSEKPVKFVINTHLHGDHTGGNDAFGAAGAVIIAQDNVRKRLSMDTINGNNQPVPARAAVALPVVTFADSATLHFNGDDLEFTHLANAHTLSNEFNFDLKGVDWRAKRSEDARKMLAAYLTRKV